MNKQKTQKNLLKKKKTPKNKKQKKKKKKKKKKKTAAYTANMTGYIELRSHNRENHASLTLHKKPRNILSQEKVSYRFILEKVQFLPSFTIIPQCL
jgi:ABC-type transport system involved in cytochrome bd biosynthesis fused ATPase/permease subunit